MWEKIAWTKVWPLVTSHVDQLLYQLLKLFLLASLCGMYTGHIFAVLLTESAMIFSVVLSFSDGSSAFLTMSHSTSPWLPL